MVAETGAVRTGFAVAALVGTWLSAAMIRWAGSDPNGSQDAGLIAVCLVLATGVACSVLVVIEVGGRRTTPAATVTVLLVVTITGSAFAGRSARRHLDRVWAAAWTLIVVHRGLVIFRPDDGRSRVMFP